MSSAMPLQQRGAALVEFAFVAVILVWLLVGLLQFGRLLYTWNSAEDATRRGARAAAIAAVGDVAGVAAAMRPTLPELAAAEVFVEYSTDGVVFTRNGGCVRGTCAFVRVSLRAADGSPALYWTGLPGIDALLPMPTFSTTVPVEALGAS